MEIRTFKNKKTEIKTQITTNGYSYFMSHLYKSEEVILEAEDRRALGMLIINWMKENNLKEI